MDNMTAKGSLFARGYVLLYLIIPVFQRVHETANFHYLPPQAIEDKSNYEQSVNSP